MSYASKYPEKIHIFCNTYYLICVAIFSERLGERATFFRVSLTVLSSPPNEITSCNIIISLKKSIVYPTELEIRIINGCN